VEESIEGKARKDTDHEFKEDEQSQTLRDRLLEVPDLGVAGPLSGREENCGDDTGD
jgi:hypothetical protein